MAQNSYYQAPTYTTILPSTINERISLIIMSNNDNSPHYTTEWILYPSTSPCYKHGDEVFIRPKSNKEIGKWGNVIIKEEQQKDNDGAIDKNRVIVELNPSLNRKKYYYGNNGGSGINNNKKKISQDEVSNNNDVDASLQHQHQQQIENKSMHHHPHQASFRTVRLIKRYRSMYSTSASATFTKDNEGYCKTNSNKCVILITEKTNHYRNLATSQLNDTDNVLEIGCSNGECSRIIYKYCNNFIGYDTSSQMIAEAKEKIKEKMNNRGSSSSCSSSSSSSSNGKVEFHTIDPFMDPKKASKIAEGANVVLIDIGGNRDLASVLRMIQWSREYLQLSAVNLIIIKSEEMFNCLNTKANVGLSTVDNDVKKARKKLKQCHNIDNDDVLVTVDDATGVISNCEKWFSERLKEVCNHNKLKETSLGPPKYSHPLKAPMALSPLDNTTPICRYKNYHKDGCKKENCKFDHMHCHWCLAQGHIALDCKRIGHYT